MATVHKIPTYYGVMIHSKTELGLCADKFNNNTAFLTTSLEEADSLRDEMSKLFPKEVYTTVVILPIPGRG